MTESSKFEEVFKLSKHYEQLALRNDPAYDKLVAAMTIVKKFISENNVILYGGTAIDYALRLYGANIYSDDTLATPDLDFYSPTHTDHAYSLCDILYNAGYTSCRAIVAQYSRVMKVDIEDNHWVADISYIPKQVFDKIPYITYNGMKLVHPDFQRIDIHSALCFPFSDPPTEAIFARWKKDIPRFNLMTKYYPITGSSVTKYNTLSNLDSESSNDDSDSTSEPVLARVLVPTDMTTYVYTGFAAYSILYTHVSKFMETLSSSVPESVPVAKFKMIDESHFSVETLDKTLEYVHSDIKKMAAELRLKEIHWFEPYVSMIPEHCVGMIADVKIKILSMYGAFLSVDSVNVHDNKKIRITNVQYLLKYFLAQSFLYPDLRQFYRRYYCGIMDMINHCENLILKFDPDERLEYARKSLLFPTINVYGSESRSLSYDIAIARIEHDITGSPLPIVPRNYYPDKKSPHPQFDPESSKIFRDYGAEITIDEVI